MLQNFGHNASDEAVEFVEQFYVDFFRDPDFENEDNRYAIFSAKRHVPDLANLAK